MTRGHYGQPGFPRRDWVLIDEEDLGQPDEICQACGRQEIRYVSVIEHPDWPAPLRVGCVCVIGLTGETRDAYAARINRLKARTRRQQAEYNKLLTGWVRNRKGNETLRHGGRLLTIFRTQAGRYTCSIRSRTGDLAFHPLTGTVDDFKHTYALVHSKDVK
jgi:hypothetical protein